MAQITADTMANIVETTGVDTVKGNAGRGTVVILVAHGSRDPAWAAPFEHLAATTGARLAFMELAKPTLADAAADAIGEGARHLRVLPLFMATGAHVRRDLPAQVAALRAAHPDRVIELLPALGEDERFWATLSDIVRAYMQQQASGSDA